MCCKIPTTLPIRLQVPLKESVLWLAHDVGGDWGHLGWGGMCGLSAFFPTCFLSHLDRGDVSQGSLHKPNNPFVSAVRGRLIVDKQAVASARSHWVNILSLAKLP